jgi:hypothetical protein
MAFGGGWFNKKVAGCWWLMPVILATQEAEIRKITIRSQLGQTVNETLPQKKKKKKKKPFIKKGWWSGLSSRLPT